jgi:hypothetical protein
LSRPYSKNLGALNKKFVTFQIFYPKKLTSSVSKNTRLFAGDCTGSGRK